MAKMFYTLEETQKILSRSEDEIKTLVQEGMLREFRDGAKIMYKVDEVDGLASEGAGDSDEIPLAADDSGEPLDLAGGSGDDIDLMAGSGDDEIDLLAGSGGDIDLLAGSGGEDIDLMAGSGDDIDLQTSDTGDQINLDDSANILSDEKDDTVITSHGTNALTESGEIAGDPLAEAAAGDLEDQIDLDSSSSGSGLLDLSREADDTSLGAELLEEIYPDATEGAIETQVPDGLDMAPESDSMMAAEIQTPPAAEYVQPIIIDDPSSGPFGAMLVVPLVMLVLLAFVAATAHAGVKPAFLDSITGYIWIIVGGAAVLSLLLMGVGLAMVGKASAPVKALEKKPKAKKAKKAKKEKKPKKEKKAKAKKKK